MEHEQRHRPPWPRFPFLGRLRPLSLILHYLETIMATQAQAAATLKAVLAQQTKTAGEISTLQTNVTTLKDQITALQAQVADGGEVTPELQTAVDQVAAQAQVVDDLIPDVVVTPPADASAEAASTNS